MKSPTLTLSTAALIALVAFPALAASRHHARHYYGGAHAYGYYRPFNAGGATSPRFYWFDEVAFGVAA